MKATIALLGLSAILTACGTSESSHEHHHDSASAQTASVEQLEKQVFAVHDEVMPRISDIMKLKKELNGKLAALDSMQGSPSETVRVDEQKAQARQLVRRLTEADSLMMAWMNRYNGDTLKALPEADAVRYLNGQMQIINDVKVKINSSIQDSQTYLKQ